MNETQTNKSYEDIFKEIEDIVQLLEKGELSLEETLKHFEEAIKRVAYCKGILSDAEQKLALLLETEDGELKLENLQLRRENNE